MTRTAWPDRLGAVLLGGGAFALYAATAAPGLTPRDSGELITAAATLGIPHPPAYPTYVLLGRLAAAVPLGSVAWRVNLLSAACAALAVALTYSLVRRLTGRALPAAFAAVLLATSRLFWQHATVAEVFTLHLALALLAWRLALAWREREPERRAPLLYALGALAGLALGNHHTIVLLGPGLLLALAWGHPRALRSRHLVGALGTALLVTAALYAFVMLRARQDPALNWGDPSTLPRLLDVFLRREFGSLSLSGAFPTDASAANRLAHAAAYGRLLLEQVGPLGLLLAAAGLVALLSDRARRWAGAGLGLAWIVSGPVLVLLLSPTALDEHLASLTEKQHLTSCALLMVLAGCGLGAVLDRFAKDRVRALALAGVAFALGPGLALPASALASDRVPQVVGRDYVDDVLDTLPSQALLITSNESLVFGLWMAQEVEGRRPDVSVVLPLDTPVAIAQARVRHAALLAGEPRVSRAFARRVFPPGPGGDLRALLRDLTWRGVGRRPVLFAVGDGPLTAPFEEFLTPRGLLLELHDRYGARDPAVLAEGERLLTGGYRLPAGRDVSQPQPVPERDLLVRYALAFNAAGYARLSQGDELSAARLLMRALSVDPSNADARRNLALVTDLRRDAAGPPTLARAQRLLEASRFAEAAQALGRLVEQEPAHAGLRTNHGYALLRSGRLAEARAELEQGLALARDPAVAEAARRNLAELADLEPEERPR